jgi:hypothetical protein
MTQWHVSKTTSWVTYRFGGRDMRLTDVNRKVVTAILA